MAIPEGYRLLTSEDVGKVFGVDLESTVYFDTSVYPYLYNQVQGMTNLLYVDAEDADIFDVYIVDNTNTYIYECTSNDSNWIIDSYTYISQVEITSFNSSWTNDWLYVKDIATDPYNITLTKPKLTVKCANATMEKDLVVQAEVYDGTVEGGEAGSGGGSGSSGDTSEGYTLTLTVFDSSSYPFGDTSGRFLYRINDGEWQTFGASPITIENVKSVDFKVDNPLGINYGGLFIRDRNSSSSYYRYFRLTALDTDDINRTTVGLKLFADLTLYISGTATAGAGGA